MNQQIATLEQYIKLKYSGNQSEWAREYGIKPSNVSRMVKDHTHYIDMTNGKHFIEAQNQRIEVGEGK